MAYIISSGESSNGIILENDTLTVLDGGIATTTTVNYGGRIEVSNEGKVINTTINLEGRTNISNGGIAKNTTVNSRGEMIIFNDGIADATIITDEGFARISSGGIAKNTTVNSHGYFYIYNGGIANNTIVQDVFSVLLTFDGGTANSSIITNKGSMCISSNGTANNTSIFDGSMTVRAAGTADDTIVYGNGRLYVSSGGTATRIIENGGFVSVETGANVSFVPHLLSEQTFSAAATIHSGTTAYNTSVSRNNLQVFSGGIAISTTIYGNGSLTFLSGCIADSVKAYPGGKVIISSGGVLTGIMNFLAGAIFSVEDGAIINFDLSRTTASAKALLSDWSLIQGTPDYTLTVTENQESGIYTLADAADDFDGTITVQNTVGESLGTLALGQTTKIGDTDYTLAVADSSLTVTIGTIKPVIPSSPTGLRAFIDGQDVALVWNASTDDTSGVKEYVVTYSFNGQDFTVRTANTNYVLNDADFGSYSWSVQAVDFAGNESVVATGDAFTVSGFKPYTVEYSADNFKHIITFAVTTPTLNAFRMPGGTYQMRVKQEGSSEWLTGDPIVAHAFEETPQLVKSDADGNADVFFANPVGTWESGYVAQHVGSINDWVGTNEYAALYGKNKLADIIEGSTDANILLMTDDNNGDTLFVDDIYTASPGNMAEQQARIARIDEIRAGAGNDIVDMTSQQFEYIGDGLTIRGGEGNDTIWANKGDNWLFGDAGNDRIVGASGNDVIAGGIGNDRMHGGGGSDVFTFCDNWGADNVEQLETGSITLWFASGSIENWDEAALTYSDGENSVKVSGVTAEQVTLKFGDDGSDEFGALSGMGAFFDATTERIFEESGKGMLASL